MAGAWLLECRSEDRFQGWWLALTTVSLLPGQVLEALVRQNEARVHGEGRLLDRYLIDQSHFTSHVLLPHEQRS